MIQGIELVDWKNYEEIIKFYETNKLYLDNFQDRTQYDSIITIIDIKIAYCKALISKNHYSDCFDILTHINIMLNGLDKNSSDYNTRYETYLFIEGVVYGYLKRYEESQSNFKELVKIDPKNDLYKDWFVGNRMHIIAKQSNIVGYTGSIIIFFSIFMDIFFKFKNGLLFTLIGLFCVILGYGFPYLIRLIDKIK